MRTAMILFAILILCPAVVSAGGAAAMAQRKRGNDPMQQQMIAKQKMMMQQEMMRRAAMEEAGMLEGEQGEAEEAPAEVADFQDVLKTFEQTSQNWSLIMDQGPKLGIVSVYIERLARQGAKIQRPVEFYVQLIDGMSQESPQMLDQNMENLLRVLAIINYDFENGQDKDALALKVLGSSQAVAQNKKRLGL